MMFGPQFTITMRNAAEGIRDLAARLERMLAALRMHPRVITGRGGRRHRRRCAAMARSTA